MYRRKDRGIEIFLIHPGGPYWEKKDMGAWSILKGEFGGDEDPLHAANREFTEETGFTIEGEFLELLPVKQPSVKMIYSFAVEGDCDPDSIKSNTFSLERPPKSGQVRTYPEVDRAAWFTVPEAGEKIIKGQYLILSQLLQLLGQG